ncbi:MAG: PEGA domain-containing protein [Terracidiphilus sp.]|jgi:hypothetical protein
MTSASFSSRVFRLALAVLLLAVPALAKDAPFQVIDWPATGTPSVRFTFARFKPLEGMGAMHGFVMDITAENLSPRLIPTARFSLYLFDKNKVRIGGDAVALTNLGPGESVKFETTVVTSGTPASVSIQEAAQAAKAVSLTVNSTPQGATLKLDGVEEGTTPRIIKVGVGKHTLTFAKEGFTVGNFPLEITPDDVSGGTVSYELGAAAFDSIELRDGSVLNGDLVSISGMDVEVRIGGAIQHLDRNKVKRVMLTQRNAPTPNTLPAAATPTP